MDKEKVAKGFVKLLEIVEKLRGPDGCSWDKEQTHESLLPYFLEETYEVIESIEESDWSTLSEELGDIMLHVALQSQIATERKKFGIADSLNIITKKLVKRHPHVFSTKNNIDSNEAKQNWESMKHKEKKRNSRLDGVPPTLPALNRAYRLQEKASHARFDWKSVDGVWSKLDEELGELKTAIALNNQQNINEEVGDVLFTIVNLARHLNIHSEDALRKANKKFIDRFKKVEKALSSKGHDFETVGQEELDLIWERAKKA
tara:strand:- start:1427 stop:2206 length:780 start_codon:yes stop_codon:yes gene_type:complete